MSSLLDWNSGKLLNDVNSFYPCDDNWCDHMFQMTQLKMMKAFSSCLGDAFGKEPLLTSVVDLALWRNKDLLS